MIRGRRFAVAVSAALAVLCAPAARAQIGREEPDAEMRRRILRRVEQWLKDDEGQLRQEIQKILDEAYGPGAPPASAPEAASPSAFLGIAVEALDEAKRVALDLADDEGVRIVGVLAGSPAERAGLERDDILVRVGRRRVGAPDGFRAAIRSHRPGDTVNLFFLREGQSRRVKVQFASAPAAATDDERRRALHEDLKAFMAEEGGPDLRSPRPPPAGVPPPARPPGGDAGRPFDVDALLDELFKVPADADNPIRALLETLRAEPAGEAIVAFLREELRINALMLREHAERGADGRWRLRPDSVEFLRTWLEDEIGRDRRRTEKEKEKKGDAPGAEAKKGPPAAPPPGKVRIGFFVRDLTDAERADAGLPAGVGFAVTRLVPGAAALRAGIRPGDIVGKIDGREATEPLLQDALAKAVPGNAVTLTVLRGGPGAAGGRRPIDVKVTLEGAPAPEAPGPSKDPPGK